MRYLAPPETTGIHLTTGPLIVVDGAVDVPDDALPGDLSGLAMNGFVLATDDHEPAAPEPEPVPESGGEPQE